VEEATKKFIIEFVKRTIEVWVKTGKIFSLPKDFPRELKERKGVFVTLTKFGNLRGCIGFPYPTKTIIEGLRDAAIASTQDPRFYTLEKDELKDVRVEVSILGLAEKITGKTCDERIEKISRNDGVILKKSGREALFLPQVWEELPDKLTFLSQLCMKAGLTPNEWKEADLYKFHADIIREG